MQIPTLETPFRRISEGLARWSTVTLYLFCQHFVPELLRDAKGPTIFRSGVRGRTVRQICAVRGATIVSRGYHPRARPKVSFSSRLSIAISSALFAARWRRHRISFFIFLTGQTRTTVGGKGYRSRIYESSFDDPSASLNLRLRHCAR